MHMFSRGAAIALGLMASTIATGALANAATTPDAACSKTCHDKMATCASQAGRMVSKLNACNSALTVCVAKCPAAKPK